MTKPKITTIVITFNEEGNISRCLSSVKAFSDEIILVDSGSTDKTTEIAKKYGAKVFFRKFDTFDSQKNYASELATGDWIFAIDADEEATVELGKEIENSVLNSEYAAYLIPRRNIILGAEIKHTRWAPDTHIWLWKKGVGKWSPGVHSEVKVNQKVHVGLLKNGKIHYHYKTIKEFLEMVNKYTDSEAEEKVHMGKNFSYFQLFGQPAYNFLVRFFYRKGILDGWRGFVLSYLMAFYHLVLWIKVWTKTKS